MNKESIYAPIILETIGNGSASIGTLKEKCGQGNKITNIRKALYTLLKDKKIEINGYDKECTCFNYNCIMLKKVNSEYTNPIYIKSLLDKPLEDTNYSKIQQIFKKRIDDINQIYYNEIQTLDSITDKMPLKEAIKSGYIKSDEIYRQYNVTKDPNKEGKLKRVTFNDFLKRHPESEIFYLKVNFQTELAVVDYIKTMKFPYFGNHKYLEYDGYDKDKNAMMRIRRRKFVGRYKSHFNHLPINEMDEKRLFDYFIISSLRENAKNRDDQLWSLASDLADDKHINFVEKMRVLEYIYDAEIQADIENNNPHRDSPSLRL